MHQLGCLTGCPHQTDHRTVGTLTNPAEDTPTTAFCMGLQKGLDLLRGHATTLGERIERLCNGLMTVGTLAALATFAGTTMLMGFRVLTEGAIHLNRDQSNTLFDGSHIYSVHDP